MSTPHNLPDEQFEVFASQDEMYGHCPPEELQEYAGLPEHPDETEWRLRAAGEWDGPGGAGEQYEAELGLHLNSTDPRRRKNARRLAYEHVQQCPQWRPPADAVPVPTILEQQGRAEGTGGIEPEQEELGGCRPSKMTPEEKTYFRKLEAEFEVGRRPRDPVRDMAWVYEHIYDDDVTARDAPSRGAWSTLFFARTYPDRFYGSVWPPAEKELQRRNETNRRGTVSEPEQQRRDEIREMIRDAELHEKRLTASEAAGNG